MEKSINGGRHRPIFEGLVTAIGRAVRAARKAVRVSQTATAQYAGVSRPAISAIERKDREPRAGELVRLASLFRIRPEQLLSGASSLPERRATPAAAFRAAAGTKLDEQDGNELASFEEALQTWPRPTALPSLSDMLPVTVVRAKLVGSINLAGEVPLDIFRLLYEAGVMLEFTAFGTLSGALLRSGPRCAVIVNSDQPEDRIRWSAAHEAAHILFEHALQDPTHIDEYGPVRGREDKIADRLAGELLVPTLQLLSELDEMTKQHPAEQVPEIVCRLADHFNVSYAALVVRLGSAGALTGEQVAELREHKPRTIESRLGLDAERPRPFVPDEWLPQAANELVRSGSIPHDWFRVFDIDAGPAIVRKLQAEAVRSYILQVPIRDRATSVTEVLERVVLWIAENHPLS